MKRNSLGMTSFLASIVVVLVSVLSGCTDPNTMRTNGPSDSREPVEHESHLAR